MNSRCTIPSTLAAGANITVLMVILFGLAVIAIAFFFILGDEESLLEDGAPTISRLEMAGDAVVDRIDSGKPGALIEGERPEKERLESIRTSLGSRRSDGQVALRGRVIHEDGRAAQNAEVRAVLTQSMVKTLRPEDYLAFKTRSTEEGRFAFDRLPMGSYSLVATAGTLGGHTEAFAVDPRKHPAAESREHEIVLVPTGSIAGRVVGPDGEPVACATVTPAPKSVHIVQTDDQGRFTLKDLEIGIYTLQAIADGMVGWSERGIRIGSTDVEIALHEGGSIGGTVTLDGKPVPGVTVTTDPGIYRSGIPVEAVTGKDGRYKLAPLAKGLYEPRVLSDEFADPEKKSITLAKGEHLENIDFQLLQNGSLSGRVTDAESGDPVEGIWVCAVPKDYSPYRLFSRHDSGREYSCVLTDADGRYGFSCRPAADLNLVTRGGMGYLPALWESGKTLRFEPGERKDGVDLQVRNGPALVVKVSSEAGDAVIGAKVTLRNAHRMNQPPDELLHAALVPGVIEEAEGRYVFDGMPAGVFDLEVVKRGWSRIKECVAVSEGEDLPERSIQLSPSLTIQGRVRDPLEKGVKDALINSGQDRYRYVLSGEDGSFTAHDVSIGQNYITVEAEGYLTLSTSIDIEKDSGSLDLILKPEGTHYLGGVVRNDLGEAWPGVTVRIFQHDGSNILQKTAETNEDGAFSFTGLSEARIQLDMDSDRGFWKDRVHDVGLDRNDLEITLQRFARIKGQAVDSSGEPVKQFTVHPNRKGGGFFPRQISSSYGEFDHDKIPPGEVTLVFSTSEGIQSESETFVLAPGEVREGVVITLGEMGTLTGVIRDKATAKPVNGASIFVVESKNDRFASIFFRHGSANATTGEDGSFTIEKQKPGIMDVYAAHPDYAEGCLKKIDVLSGMTTGPLEILLERGCVVQGKVFVDGRGEAGIQVEADKQNPYQRFETITGDEGRYEIRGLSAAEYEISAVLRNEARHNSVRRTIKARPGEVVQCDLSFAEGGTIEGTVYVLGEPMGGVFIHVFTARGPDQSAEAQSDRSLMEDSEQDGSYRIEGIGPGRYRIRANFNVEKRSFSYNKEIDVRPGVNVFDIHMGEEGSCELFGFVYENNAPAANVDVSISASGAHSSMRTGGDGVFRLGHLPAGKINLYASMRKDNLSNLFRVSRQLELKEGESRREDLHYTTGTGVLFGHVRENGAPVPDAFINLEGDTTGGSGKVSMTHFSFMEGDGTYRFEFLPAGRYELRLARPLRIMQEVFLKDAEERQMDFDYGTGSASIQGTVKVPEGEKETGAVGLYLFKAGACKWEEGITFRMPSLSEGLIAMAYVNKGKFSQGKLPAGAFDVVAVRHKDEVILRLDIQRITLADGESKTVNLGVLDK